MLAVETTPTPLFKQQTIFRHFTQKERSLQIFIPTITETPSIIYIPPHQSLQKPMRRSTLGSERDHVPVAAPVLPPFDTRPTQGHKASKAHTRRDSGTFPDLQISRQFTRTRSSSPGSSQRSSTSSRRSSDTTSSIYSRVYCNAHTTSPFPHNTQIEPWNLFLPPAQVHALYIGFAPVEIADEWFVFSEGPDVYGKLKVHFHRAWTGLKVAELFVVIDLKGEGAGKIVGTKWNRSEQTGRIGEIEAKNIIRASCKNTLGFTLEVKN